MSYFELSDKELSSFLVTTRHTVLQGPVSLVRFTNAGGSHGDAPGKFDKRAGIYRAYWMYASEVAEVLDAVAGPGPYGLKVVQEVSGRWAVCDDWNNLQRVWALNIPAGQSVDAYFGRAKFQPRVSAKGQAESGKTTNKHYDGGSMQWVVGLQHNQIAWIKGPQSTLSLSKKKLAALCKV